MKSIIIKKNESDLTANSMVKEVTIYSDRALVTRAQRFRFEKGGNRIVFSNLGSGIDEQSIKAQLVSPGARITSTSIERNFLYFFREDEDEKTYKKILDVLASLCKLADDATIFALENRMLADLNEYIRNLLNALILAQENSIPKFKEALDFCDTLFTKNASALIGNKKEMERLAEEYEMLGEELRRIRSLDKREQNNIAILAEADSPIEMEIELTYAIAGASWKTSYDCKADTTAKTADISYYGEITQSTGEIWNNAKIVLSTSVSETSAKIPDIYPAYMGGYSEKRKKDIVIEETAIKNLRDESDLEHGEAAPEAEQETEPAKDGIEEGRIRAEKKGVSYTFAVIAPLDIPPDGKWHRGLILRGTIPADLFYDTVPRLKEFVYLRADVKNSFSVPLLPGRVFVYRNGSYMGRSDLQYIAPDEQFYLSFGIDDDLRIKRIEYKNETIPARGLSNKNIREWEYHFILYNFKKNNERVRLREGIYVSALKEIEVAIAKETSEGYSMDKEGVVSWNIDLPHDPFEHKKLVLRYSLAAPKDFNIGALQ